MWRNPGTQKLSKLPKRLDFKPRCIHYATTVGGLKKGDGECLNFHDGASSQYLCSKTTHLLGHGLETSPPFPTSASLGGQALSRACSRVSMALSQKQEEETHTELGVSAMLL